MNEIETLGVEVMQPRILQDMAQSLLDLKSKSLVESYHDVIHNLSKVQEMFSHGALTLAQRAIGEQLYLMACRELQCLLNPKMRNHQEIIDELNEKLADKYFCNFSVFQSMPDVWAIDQVFPVMPLHRLTEAPSRRAVIADLTCDSDGRLDFYVDDAGVESTLPLHEFIKGDDYLLGFFMVGAYQEILGDIHNLFGDTHAVSVELLENGGYQIVETQVGDDIEAVLKAVHYCPEALLDTFRKKLKKADLDAQTQSDFLTSIQSGLNDYTYLEY